MQNPKAEIAAILKTSEANIDRRLVGLKIAPYCGRCGGGGNYSYCYSHGTQCFGCKGAGHVRPKADGYAALIPAALECVASGKLAAYLAEIAARKAVKNGFERLMAAWKAVDALNGYGGNWRNAHKPEFAAVTARNKRCFDAVQAFHDAQKGKKPLEIEAALNAGLKIMAEVLSELQGENAA